MKKTVSPLLAAAVVCLGTAMSVQAQTTLFSDSFDRPDNRNIDGSLTGITDNTGSSLPVDGVYSQPFVDPVYESTGVDDGDSFNGGGADITNNTLRLAVGVGTSCAYVNHNFTNASIISDGGFSISMDVTDYAGTARQNGGGFAIGMSEFEAAFAGDAFVKTSDNMTGAFHSNPHGVVGQPVGPTIISDFWIALRGNNSIAWGSYTNNVMGVGENGLTNKTGTITVDFDVTSFVAGTTVAYEVFYNGVSLGQGSFEWSETGANYIGIDGRDGTAVSFDDFSISTKNVVFTNSTVTLAVTPDIVGEDTASNPVELTFSTFNPPAGSTYTIVADKAVTYPSGGDTGSAQSPSLPIDAIVDGTLGDVTFTLYISNALPALVASNSVTVTAVKESPALLSTLFSDNYDRLTFTTNDFDIDSSSTGMGGTLAPLVYLETCEKANISTTNWDDSFTLIELGFSGTNEVCRMANGAGMSIWGLDNNFTNSSILTDGGFSVAMDVVEINSAISEPSQRWSGFGVGLTLAEINAFADEAGGDLQGPRGRTDNLGAKPNSGMSDFYTSVALNNQLQVLANGVVVGVFPLTTNAGRLRADFGVTNFNEGSFVAYQVYFDGLLRTEGFFEWQQDGQNYVGVSSRASTYVDIDNLDIGTVSVPFTPPATHPDLATKVAGLTPSTPPFGSIDVAFNSVTGVTYRADITASFTNAFGVAEGTVGGEAVFLASTNSTTSATVSLPGGFETNGFLKISPVHWPGPIVP